MLCMCHLVRLSRFPFTCDISILSSPHVQYLVALAYSFVADLISVGYFFATNTSTIGIVVRVL